MQKHGCLQESVRVGSKIPRYTTINTCSIPGGTNGLNEDAYVSRVINGVLVFGVFDGTTSLKPIKELQSFGITGANFASNFIKNVIDDTTEISSPSQVLIRANNLLLSRSLAFSEVDRNDTHCFPASMATLCHLDFDYESLNVSHVGDSFVVLYDKDGTSNCVTPDTNKKFDAQLFSMIEEIASNRKITKREARQTDEVKEALLSMFQFRNNRPDGTGSGLVNGDPNFETYINSQTFCIGSLRRILVGSDGLCPPGWDITNSDVQSEMSRLFDLGGIEEIFRTKHFTEDADPDWNITRYKHSDDATAIVVDL